MTSACMVNKTVNILNSASFLSASQASTDYYIMERSGCCAVVGMSEINWIPESFGNNPMPGGKQTTLIVESFLRDHNDPTAIMADNTAFIEEIVDTIAADTTLDGSIDVIREITARRNAGEAVSMGGAVWLPAYITVIGFEFTD